MSLFGAVTGSDLFGRVSMMFTGITLEWTAMAVASSGNFLYPEVRTLCGEGKFFHTKFAHAYLYGPCYVHCITVILQPWAHPKVFGQAVAYRRPLPSLLPGKQPHATTIPSVPNVPLDTFHKCRPNICGGSKCLAEYFLLLCDFRMFMDQRAERETGCSNHFFCHHGQGSYCSSLQRLSYQTARQKFKEERQKQTS